MSLMEWTSALDVGVPKMNDEHKEILTLMNRLYEAKQNGRSGPAVIALLNDLGRVTTEHFADEEAYMAQMNYPGLKVHKRIHADLLRKFADHSAQITAQNGEMPEAFFSFLRLWLSAHIKGIDMKYAPAKTGQVLTA